jgi:hypothetical protein
MHTLFQRLIPALSLGLFFTIVHAAPPIPINLSVPDSMGGKISGPLEVHLYLDEEDWNPLASQYFQDDEWQLRAQVSDTEGDSVQKLTVKFTQYDSLEPGQTVYAEVVLGGWVLEERLAVIVPGPLMSIEGIIESRIGGIQYPDGSIQDTAGITTETDPTVPAYLLNGIQWDEVSDRPAGLDDGDDDTTYSAGTGLVLEGTTFRVDEGLFNGGLFWKLDGNAAVTPSQFLGTTDNQALELRVNGGRALRLEPGSNSPNVLGGYALNAVTGGAEGVTISGGGRDLDINHVSQGYATISGGAGNSASGYASTIGGGEGQEVSNSYATIGGGTGNIVSGASAVISGGRTNQALGGYASVGGGQTNIASSYYATISGGVINTASGSQSTVGGGAENVASGEYATVGGGRGGLADAKYSVIAGGGPSDEENPFTSVNRVTDDYGTVGGGGANIAGDGSGTTDDAAFATVAGGRENHAMSSYAVVSGGNVNNAHGYATTIGGGEGNVTDNNYGTVSGGMMNTAVSQWATVAGGRSNTAGNTYATVGGGYSNSASGAFAVVPGGAQNTASGTYSLAAGQGATAAHTGSFVWSDSNTDPFSSTASDQFLIRAAGGVGIGTNSPAGALHVVGDVNVSIKVGDRLVSLGSTDGREPGCETGALPDDQYCLQFVPAVSVVGNTSFLASSSSNTLAAFDVTDPQNIKVIGLTTDNLHLPVSVVARGNHAYVASHGNGRLVVFETSPELVNVGIADLPGQPEDVFVSGTHAYLVGIDATPFLVVVDISDPHNPVVRGSVPTGGTSVHVSGSLAYVAAPAGLNVYDVSDPGNVVLLGSTSDLASSPSAVHVSGHRAYVTMQTSNSLVVYDIANPAAPAALGSSPTGSLSRPVSVTVSGDLAFVACEGEGTNEETNGVVVFDVSDPANIELQGTTSEVDQRVHAVAAAGKKVFVTSDCVGEGCEGGGADSRFAIYEFTHMETPALQAGNLQAGYLDVIGSASVANGLNVGGGLNAGQAYVGGDLGVGGDLRMLGSIGGQDEFFCAEFNELDNCLDWDRRTLTFANDIFLSGHWVVGTSYNHCPEGLYDPDLDCCLIIDEFGEPGSICDADVIPIGLGGGHEQAVAVDGNLVPACDAGHCKPGDFGWSLGHPDLRWNQVWAANGVIQTSDGRLKQHVKPLAYGLADLARLEPVSFAWKEGDPDSRHLGLIAQDVREVLPELVREGDDSDIMGLNYSELVPVLINAVKELSSQVSGQALTIDTLTERLNALEKEKFGDG